MNGPLKLAAPVVLALAFAGCNAGGMSSVPAPGGQSAASFQPISLAQSMQGRRVCHDTRPGYMNCDAITEREGLIGPDVAGWTAPLLEQAYNLPSSSNGKGTIVAIVDAFDNPNVAKDLDAYRSEFTLPAVNFKKYNQTGQQSNYPAPNAGWGVEIDLDVEMVSASCPNCTIYLIETNDNYNNNLYAGEEEAVKLGAHIVSNSWGGGGGYSTGGAFDTPGVTYLASAGDGGYGMQDPADYDNVVSVGGTVLSKSGSPPVYADAVWPMSGGGCSVVEKPSWQKDPKCTMRTGNDVSALAAGVAEYDSFHEGGWLTEGGTSVSSPFTAGVFGLTTNYESQTGGKRFWTLTNRKRNKDLRYVSSGKVIKCPSNDIGTYLCQAGTKEFGRYSSPSGWGVPNGIGAY